MLSPGKLHVQFETCLSTSPYNKKLLLQKKNSKDLNPKPLLLKLQISSLCSTIAPKTLNSTNAPKTYASKTYASKT